MKSTSKQYKQMMTKAIYNFEDHSEWDKALKNLEEVQKCHKVTL